MENEVDYIEKNKLIYWIDEWFVQKTELAES